MWFCRSRECRGVRQVILGWRPKNADLQLETSNGAVDVSSLNGNISIHTSNGRIRVRGI
jgi:hypothetical protein